MDSSTLSFNEEDSSMNRMMMAVMAVAVSITFLAPAFAEEKKKEEKKGGHVVVFGDEKKKEEKKGGHVDTFADADKEKKPGK